LPNNCLPMSLFQTAPGKKLFLNAHLSISFCKRDE
jgi:hypothetical protein